MGQMFRACAYDIEKRICSEVDADKFHANCYSFSDAVASVHYLLRQKPYHVMWGGGYVAGDFFAHELSEDILLGLSIYMDRKDIERNNASKQQDNENFRNNAEFVINNSASWKKIEVWNEAMEFFDNKNTHSVRYEGFLVNHTKKQAVDLDNYYKKSLSMTKHMDLYAIDLIPGLTETGGGLGMALFDGMTSATTEKLDMQWCGDLLQIVDDLPDGYERIDCCFANSWGRARFCYPEYGVDEEDFLLEQQGKRFVCCKLNLSEVRSPDSFMKAQNSDDIVHFSTVPVVQIDQV
jgi:hypothetical protein